MRVWRICRARHAATAFSGEGARRFAGRWHPVGMSVVYTSLSLSLAAMEMLVHLDPAVLPDDLVSLAATVPAEPATCERIGVETLPTDWRRIGLPELQAIGAAWVHAGRSLTLLVPSAVIEGEWNALLNPLHPDMAKLTCDLAKPFFFDARLFR